MPRATRAARKTPRPYHHGNLRRALLDEALATIRTDGVEGLTLREIGARLGVSRTALYRHFADKRDLLATVATEGFRMLHQRLVAAWEEGGRNPAAFESMGNVRRVCARESFALSRHVRGIRQPRGLRPGIGGRSSGRIPGLVDALATLQRDGIMRAEATVTMARFVWAVVHGVAMLGIDGQLPERGSVEELMRYAFDRLRTGIGARSAPAAAKSQ